jgi:uncharacterized protein (TIGR02284 family)
MNMDIVTLNEMIEVLEDGRKFYTEAAEKVRRPDLKTLFADLAKTKAEIAGDLQAAAVHEQKTPVQHGSLADMLHILYAEARAKLSSDKDYTFVAALEESEDRILHVFGNAIVNSEDPKVRAIAQKHLAALTRSHAQMRNLKHARAA